MPTIGIHHRPGSYSDKWIEYCEKNGYTPRLSRSSKKFDHIMIWSDDYSKIHSYDTKILESCTNEKLASDHAPVYTHIELEIV